MDILQPKGVRDFPPEEKILRDKVIAVLKRQFELYGFNPLETPVLERWEVLAAKYAGGAEILKETFKLKDQGDRDLGLRYDLTVPLARFIAMNPNVKLPFKRYAIGTVYRDGPIKLGRYREFYQCDCDIVGANTAAADAQCIQLGLSVFSELKLEATMAFNSVALLKLMLLRDGCSEEKIIDAMLTLDKLKKIGEREVIAELESKRIPGESVLRIIAIAQLGTNDEKVRSITEAYGTVPELERIRQLLEMIPDQRLIFDPSLSRGLSYYTGVVFEIYITDSPVLSPTTSASAGGRYDRMVGEFIGRPDDYPAIGISFGLEPITEHLKAVQQAQQKTVVKVFVIPIKTPVESNALCQELRQAGINADTDIMDRGISKNMDYANMLSIPYVVFVGRKELEQGQYKLKAMASGEELMLTKDALIEKLKNA
jgi:histidyl-tRNA synthetase